jgi:hypothetical protein
MDAGRPTPCLSVLILPSANLHDRVSALRTANIYERHSYRHIVGLPVIGAPGNDGLAAETPFRVARIMRDGRTDLSATLRKSSRAAPISPPLS